MFRRKREITEADLDREKLKMAIEKKLRGRWLAGHEREVFWAMLKDLAK